MSLGLFLPPAVEGQYDTYLHSITMKYTVISAYVLLLLFLSLLGINTEGFFTKFIGSLIALLTVVFVYFVFWFQKNYGLSCLLKDASFKDAFQSLSKALVIFLMLLGILFFSNLFFEKGGLGIRATIAIVSPYISSCLFYYGIYEAFLASLILVNLKKRN